MTDNEKFKEAIKEMGLRSSFIYNSVGYTKNSYYSALSRDSPNLPEFAWNILWIYENCGRPKTLDYLEALLKKRLK